MGGGGKEATQEKQDGGSGGGGDGRRSVIPAKQSQATFVLKAAVLQREEDCGFTSCEELRGKHIRGAGCI